MNHKLNTKLQPDFSNESGQAIKERFPVLTNSWFIAFFILITAFFVRLVVIFQLQANSPIFNFPLIDSMTYDRLARALVNTWQWPEKGAFFQPPAYPYFLAILYRILGESYFWAKVAQSFLGAVNCLLVSQIGSKIACQKTGLIAGMICAFYGPLIYFELDFMAVVLIHFWL